MPVHSARCMFDVFRKSDRHYLLPCRSTNTFGTEEKCWGGGGANKNRFHENHTHRDTEQS